MAALIGAPGGAGLHLQEVEEKLKRILLTGGTEITPHAVSVYLVAQVVPLLAELGIQETAICLFPREKPPVVFSTVPGYAPAAPEIEALLAGMGRFGSFRFSVHKGADTYLGYSGNDLDWVVVKAATGDGGLLEGVIDALWYQFFEFD